MATPIVKSSGEEHDILLFDGVCNLCNWATRFVIKRDPTGHFQFAALQSPAAKMIASERRVSLSYTRSVVLISGHQVYTKSSAALRVLKQLRGLWPCLSIFLVVPRPIRDLIYDFIAQNRYRWFGRRDQCMVPTAEIRARFLCA